MVKTNEKQPTRPARIEPVVSGAQNEPEGPAHVRASFKPDGRGGGTLQLRYTGQLTSYDAIWVRLGERRGGADWLDTRDVKMDLSGGQAVARVSFAAGAPLEGASFAFFALKDGQGGEPAWDSAGKPFGCYVLDAATGAVSVR